MLLYGVGLHDIVKAIGIDGRWKSPCVDVGKAEEGSKKERRGKREKGGKVTRWCLKCHREIEPGEQGRD